MIEKLQYISQELPGVSHLDAIQQALQAGAKWIQLRVKNKSEAEVLDLAFGAKNQCTKFKAKLIINDFPNVARKVLADGLHLGLHDMPIPEARSIVGEKVIIGGTANTFEDILLRVTEGADYVGLGPYRFTKTKEKLSPILGLEGYQVIIRNLKEARITIPIIAIGGITTKDILPLLDTGVYGIALSGAITFAENKKKVLEELSALGI